ncbi:glycosyltransferase [Acidomonas methanolica]|uniref:Glycosyl transferase n=1 Tax=Acidomonas methanolica NBRC 104435 TaxID=1231351 RepID=A0A023D4Z9_ACIMT|nr:glycosyltransferase [Acidomonas methanolica]TCS20578.1 GT2 family glycosyltransferase [Acidomonas methanolica]GAJ29192.1 glycosyl transferase [Acidomonas methanolica NBRC 104435]GBQ45444.1 glycosyltransferase [Acidomonas methanolica]GEL00564.1 hypothetical protein AME01nite_30620 [Acidomonas methanolica NBRC 104435]
MNMILSDGATESGSRWDHIDLAWVMQSYPETREFFVQGDTIAFADLLLLAGRCGYSPNPYFDEIYYVRRYPDVRQAIADGTYVSGFDHYRSAGYRDRNPHWLFSEEYYLAGNPDVGKSLANDGVFRNGYDHYLRCGDGEFRSGSWFFDPLEYIKSTTGEAARAPFSHYLTHPSGYSNSPYFDTDWFIRAYPDVLEEVRHGDWKSILHQYLGTRNEGRYDPSRFFSERFYVESNPDLSDAIASGRFISGYEHFLLYGIHERRRPSPDIDLERFYHHPYVQKLLLNGRVPDVFVAWCRSEGEIPDVEAALEDKEKMTKLAFEKKSAALAITVARRKLDFSSALPDISVILVLHNNFDMTMNALTALRASHAGGIDLILADSGSHDETRRIGHYIDGANIQRFDGNVGFVRACNVAAGHAKAPFLLFLNNDAEVQPGSIAAAIERLRRDPKVGVVGGKLIRTNGLLQEAGSIIYRDGSVDGYMRGRSPDVPEANFVRRVDFCSGACLFTRTELFRQLGGFDEAYIPAYYEETDYCVRVWKSGQEVIYDPAVTAIHYEYGTSDLASGAGYINRNRLIFNSRHRDFLTYKLVKSKLGLNGARSPARSGARRILFIEDRIPLKCYGSGFSRSHDIVETLASMGHDVTVFPIFKPDVSINQLYAAFPENVEIIWDRELGELESFLHQRAGLYDVIWICRTQNVRRLVPVIERTAHFMPHAMLIADTEAVSAIREEQHDRLLGLPEDQFPTLAERLRAEFECLLIATKIVAVSPHDATVLTEHGFAGVSVLGHVQTPRRTSRPWAERSGLLFVGAMHDYNSPNYDSVAWLVTTLWPMLENMLPGDATLTIAGYLGPGVSFSALPRSPRVSYIGEVEDLTPLYDSARFFIAPTRYAASIPYKLYEAAAYGLPIVASDILCRQTGWKVGDEILEARAGDAEDFGRVVVDSYDNQVLWNALRDKALVKIMNEDDQKSYVVKINKILNHEDEKSYL